MKKIILAMALLAVGACQKNEEKTTAAPALPVEVAHPIIRDITLTREYPGYLAADATIPIVGRVNGTITKRSFTEGQRVKKGDPLFTIAFTRNVSRNGNIFAFTRDLIDFININYTLLGAFHVEVGCLNQF